MRPRLVKTAYRVKRDIPSAPRPTIAAMSVISIPVTPEHEVSRGSDRLVRLRHLGQAETIVLRDTDVMRIGLRVRLYSIKSSSLSIISPMPLRLGEQVKVKLRNDVQRFATELRGVARRLAPTADDNFLIGIELFSRLMPLDVMMLRRAGVADVQYAGKIWV